jgi:hypothetical protein
VRLPFIYTYKIFFCIKKNKFLFFAFFTEKTTYNETGKIKENYLKHQTPISAVPRPNPRGHGGRQVKAPAGCRTKMLHGVAHNNSPLINNAVNL